MSKFNEMISSMKAADFSGKKQFLQYFLNILEHKRGVFSADDTEELLRYAFEEVDHMLRAIPEESDYKEKDIIFDCEDALMGIIIHLCGTPAKLSPDKLAKVKALTELVKQERYIESALDEIFQKPSVTEADINRVLYWVRQTLDEYQKSKLFLGLGYYHRDVNKLSPEARQILKEHMLSELRRLMDLNNEDAWHTLEVLADVCRYFADENILAALLDVIKLERNHINIYAVDTLCGFGRTVPQPVIDALAKDLEYADTLHHILKRSGMETMFPAEYNTEEYLAKSDLVRWLTYPTELGQAPDEIEYLGKIKQLFKKEVFHVFKYRSDSATLSEESKNHWLIGWSSNEGGTFSNFDLLAPFEMETTEKTLKLIKKKLIGR